MSLRLVDVPEAAPPYDCETHGPGCPAMRAAAASRQDLTRDPGSRPALESMPGSRSALESVPGSRSVLESMPGSRSALESVPGSRSALESVPGSRSALESVPGSRSALESVPGSRSALESVPGSRSALESVPGSRSALAGAGAAGPAGTLPWHFAQLIVEIMAGLRPQKQIIGLTTDHAREQARRLAPLLASDRRPRIQRIATSRPAARAVEMTVIVNIGPRSRALAMRLEHLAGRPATPGRPARPDRWLCTAIEAG